MGNSSQAKKQKKSKRRRSRAKKALAGVGVALVGFVGSLLLSDHLQEKTCQVLVGSFAGGIFAYSCGDEYRTVPSADAEQFLMTYFDRAAGADSSAAYPLLSGKAKEKAGSRDEFIAAWDHVSGAELVGDIARTETKNTFDVQFRWYWSPSDADRLSQGKVWTSKNKITLSQIDGALSIVDMVPRSRKPLLYKYPYVQLTSDHATYHLATLSSEPALQVNQARAGSSLNVLCILEPVDSSIGVDSDSGKEWLRTAHGWIPSSAMRHFDREGVVRCDSRYATIRHDY